MVLKLVYVCVECMHVRGCVVCVCMCLCVYELFVFFMSSFAFLSRVVSSIEGGIELSLITRKPVFGVSDQVRFRPAYSATEAS